MSFDWWTFGLQAANVLILLAILRHFLFRPVAEIVERRRRETAAALDAAEVARQAARDAEGAAQAEAQANRTARDAVLTQARAEAEALRQAQIQAAHTEAAHQIAEGRATLERETRARAAQGLRQAIDLGMAAAGRALAAQPAGLPGYAARLADLLNDLPAARRAALVRGGNLRLVSATPPDPAEHAAILQALAPHGIAPRIDTDPALIAGLDLRSDSGVVQNSLAHDIDRIAQALHDDAGH